MHEAVEPSGDVRALVGSMLAPIRAEMQEVEQILRAELASDAVPVDEMLRHCASLGGKRLRPALVLLSGRAVGPLTPAHLTAAAVVEMIHAATLVHDDILDEARVRRHRPTANALWGNQASVLLGDFLFTHAFYLASTLDSTYACRTIGRATNIVCEGELRQVASRCHLDVDESEYLAMIDAKTAELCACCCRLGAHYAGGEPSQVEDLAKFGRLFGIAFQITDDVLDIQGDEQIAGKSLGTDADQLKPTLPLIRLLAQLEPADRQRVNDDLLAAGADRPSVLQAWLPQTDALAYSRRRAVEFAHAARNKLNDLPDSDARELLSRLCDFVCQRNA